jgi:hypothetical protein
MNAFDAKCFMTDLANGSVDLEQLSKPEEDLLWALQGFFSDLASPEPWTRDHALPRLKEHLK